MNRIARTAVLSTLTATFLALGGISLAGAQSSSRGLDEAYRELDTYIENRNRNRRDRQRLEIQEQQLYEIQRQNRALERLNRDIENERLNNRSRQRRQRFGY